MSVYQIASELIEALIAYYNKQSEEMDITTQHLMQLLLAQMKNNIYVDSSLAPLAEYVREIPDARVQQLYSAVQKLLVNNS